MRVSDPLRLARLLAALHLILAWGLAAGVAAQDADCPRWRAAFAGMPERTVTIETPHRSITLRVKVADTPERQAAGFQCATPDEVQDHHILFDFGEEVWTQFHMRNVPAALDIAFARADGRLVAILRMEPHPTRLYGPLATFRYAIEARAGFFAAAGIITGPVRLHVVPR